MRPAQNPDWELVPGGAVYTGYLCPKGDIDHFWFNVTQPGTTVTVTLTAHGLESGDTVEVSNGIVGFKINKASFNGFESVTYKGKKLFKAAKAGLAANHWSPRVEIYRYTTESFDTKG